MIKAYQHILMYLMVWCGSKLFDIVDVYSPNQVVRGIVFTDDEEYPNYCGKYEKKTT